MQSSKVVNLVVGGNNFCFRGKDLERFPDSYFAHFLKDEWTKDRSAAMYIDRNGLLFYNVFSYIVNDSLGFSGEAFNLDTLVAIRREADFYNLPGMVVMCDVQITSHIRQWCTRTAATRTAFTSRFTCEPEYSSTVSPIFRALNDAVRPATAATSTTKQVFLLPSFGALQLPSNDHSQRCVDVSSFFSEQIRKRVRKECRTWPGHHVRNMVRAQRGIYLYPTGGYCRQRTPTFAKNGHILKGITLYIPHTCVYKGGKITAMGCGQVKSIEKPGECMCLRAGMSYSVETVMSGKLAVMEVEFFTKTDDEYIHTHPSDPTVDRLTFSESFNERSNSPIRHQHRHALTTAINSELSNYSAAVIICLTSLYPITHSPEPDNNHIYTDPEALKGKDAMLYTMLCENYTVSVVTVFLCRTVIGGCVTTAATASHATASTPSTASPTLVGCIVDSTLPEIAEGAQYKIVPVVFGYGETFLLGNQQVGTLLTGLLVTAQPRTVSSLKLYMSTS